MQVRFIDELEHGFGWTQDDSLRKASHAVLARGRVWVTDPLDGDGIDERIGALGDPAAVVQLLDRHSRDCAEVARRLGVPHVVTPFEGVAGAPWEPRRIVRLPTWREVALWFPAERILVTADALGGVGYFRAQEEPFGVHPLLRLFPPRRSLGDLEPRHLLFGHGEGYHGDDAPERLREALRTSRRRLPSALRSAFRSSS